MFRRLVPLLIPLAFAASAHADQPPYTMERGVRLGRSIQPVLRSIADEFRARTGRRLHITSGTRSSLEQAEAMYAKLRMGQRLTRLYRDYESAAAIQRAYRQNRRRGRRRCVAAMAAVIERQVREGTFISLHLRASAADVRSRNMNRRQRRIFRRVVAGHPEVELLEEGRPPHWHLQL